VLVPGSQITEGELIEYLRGRLAHYKCPKRIGFRDELPRNASGKVLRHVLRAEFADSPQHA
jgi:acyl-CoA synthetase (AMP-forming)/AMP-acid ligase II